MCHSIDTVVNGSTVEEVAAVITAYHPRSMPEAAGAFARTVVALVDPASPARAKALLWCCARLATFGASAGLGLDPAVLLHPSVIERFVDRRAEKSRGPPGARCVPTCVTWLPGRRCAPAGRAGRERAKTPYSQGDIAAYLALADAQPTVARRMRAVGLICLGPVRADRRRPSSRPRHRRAAPPRRGRGDGERAAPPGGAGPGPLPPPPAAAAGFAGDGYLIGGRHPAVTTSPTGWWRRWPAAPTCPASTPDCGPPGWPRWPPSLGLPALFAAAGITCSQHLGDIVAALAVPAEADLVRLLGAAP